MRKLRRTKKMKKFWEIIGIVSAIVGSVFAFAATGWWLVLCCGMVIVPLIVEGISDRINKNVEQSNNKENESI